MEKNTKIIIGVVAIILIVVVAVFFVVFTADKTLSTAYAEVTIPGSFSIDSDTGVATNETISVVMLSGDAYSDEMKYLQAIKANGPASGYQNITNTTINGFKVYEYAGSPLELKNVSTNKARSGDYLTWTTYRPFLPYDTAFSNHFRFVDYIKDGHTSNLFIYTSSPNVDLYTADIEKIIHSVKEVGQ